MSKKIFTCDTCGHQLFVENDSHNCSVLLLETIKELTLDKKVLDFVEQYVEEIYAIEEHEQGEQIRIGYVLDISRTGMAQGDDLRSVVLTLIDELKEKGINHV